MLCKLPNTILLVPYYKGRPSYHLINHLSFMKFVVESLLTATCGSLRHGKAFLRPPSLESSASRWWSSPRGDVVGWWTVLVRTVVFAHTCRETGTNTYLEHGNSPFQLVANTTTPGTCDLFFSTVKRIS